MSDIIKRIDRIKFLLTESYNKMQFISDENFDNTMAEVKLLLNESKQHKIYLMSKYSADELKTYEAELTRLTKQVAEIFDNISKKKKDDLAILANKIKFVQNRKKLANYHR